ncbi:hypothetical protein, partial [Kitasatospora sp. NPDC085879]|uniref:hypothetical protein n=1 Tax=Kitasatospora sp. NPDC085879 TaxID=3154769 RepID=UPI003418D159
MSADRRLLRQLFSDTATDGLVAADDRARLLPVERAPFLEPRTEDMPPAVPAVPGARRRLGPGHLADTDLPDAGPDPTGRRR